LQQVHGKCVESVSAFTHRKASSSVLLLFAVVNGISCE
jgi:hypothetical protein